MAVTTAYMGVTTPCQGVHSLEFLQGRSQECLTWRANWSKILTFMLSSLIHHCPVLTLTLVLSWDDQLCALEFLQKIFWDEDMD